MRFLRLFALVVLAAGAFASTASAGGYTDASYITPVGKVGQPYYHQVQWKPGTGCPPYTYAVVGGDFPPGLNLSSSGYITGTPTREGVYTFYIRQTDQCGPEGEGNSPFRITIQSGAPPQPPLVFATSTLAPATLGSAYSATLSSSGGSSYSYSLIGGSLPPGLALSADGHITGTPTGAGNFLFTARVRDQSGRTADRQLSLEVKVPLGITQPTVPVAEARRHFSLQLQAVGGAAPYHWSAPDGLPEGLFLDADKGIIVGAPKVAGTYTPSIAVTDAAGATKTIDLTLRVEAKLHFVATTLRAARAGVRYSAKVAVAGGVGAVTFELQGRLPKGFTFDAKTGLISGKTKAVGRFNLIVSAVDSFGKTSNRFVLVVR